MNMPITVVVYNDEICYGVQLLKLNDYHTDHYVPQKFDKGVGKSTESMVREW